MDFVIEKGVYIPEKISPFSQRVPVESKYPFAQMEVGDSFAVPGPDKKMIGNLGGARAAYQKKNPGVKFTTRSLKAEGILRIWRIS